MDIAPTERLKLMRQMPAAAGKKESVSLSLFTEVKNLVVEENFHAGHVSMAAGIWMGSWAREQREAWRKQVFDVHTWRQVRGPAGAVMCENGEMGSQTRV